MPSLNPEESRNPFADFINDQLDLTGFDAPSPLTQDEFSQLLGDDIYAEVVRLVRSEMQDPDALPLKFGMLHREVLYHLSTLIGKILRAKYPQRMTGDEWRDAAALSIALAWAVRAHLDADDTV